MVCEQESKQGLIKISPAKSETGLLESDSLLLLRWSLKTTPNHLGSPVRPLRSQSTALRPSVAQGKRQRLCLLRHFPAPYSARGFFTKSNRIPSAPRFSRDWKGIFVLCWAA